jgi:hypothetical protein
MEHLDSHVCHLQKFISRLVSIPSAPQMASHNDPEPIRYYIYRDRGLILGSVLEPVAQPKHNPLQLLIYQLTQPRSNFQFQE